MDVRLRSLRDSPIFEGLSVPEIDSFLESTHVEELPDGGVVFADGDAGECLYLVASGRARITKRSPDGKERHLGDIPEKMVFGEMSLLTGCPRSATIAASGGPLVLCRVDPGPFDRLVRGGSAAGAKLLYNVARSLARRLAQATDVLADELGRKKAPDPGDLAVFKEQLLRQWTF